MLTGPQFGAACIILALASALMKRPLGPAELVVISFVGILLSAIITVFRGPTPPDKPKV